MRMQESRRVNQEVQYHSVFVSSHLFNVTYGLCKSSSRLITNLSVSCATNKSRSAVTSLWSHYSSISPAKPGGMAMPDCYKSGFFEYSKLITDVTNRIMLCFEVLATR